MDFDSELPIKPAHTHKPITPVVVIIACVSALLFLGVAVMYSASAPRLTDPTKYKPTYFLIKQLIGIGLGTIVALIVSRLNFEGWRNYVRPIAVITIILLLLVFVPYIGIKVNGSNRWLGYGPFRFQISELGKFVFAFCLAHYLAINQAHMKNFMRGCLLPTCIIAAFAAPIAAEMDIGTAALLFAVGVLMLYLAGLHLGKVILTILMGAGAAGVLIITSPNRLSRLLAFIGHFFGTAAPEKVNKSDTWQLDQSLASFAVGGLDGAGLGQGRQQFAYLPEAHTDFIFAIIGEELGFYGTIAIVILFLIIFIAGLLHLRRAPNMFQYLFSAGCFLFIILQAVINLLVVTGAIPTKGMSLPFISYGMSNLVFMGAAIGVFINNQRNWPRPAFSRTERILKEVVQT